MQWWGGARETRSDQGRSMAAAFIPKFKINANSGGSLAFRVYNPSGSLITQATVSSISARYRRKDRTDTLTSSSPVVASTVYNSLQTDIFWKDDRGNLYDDLGYNFRWDFSASIFTAYAALYGLEFTFTPSSGAAYTIPCIVQTAETVL